MISKSEKKILKKKYLNSLTTMRKNNCYCKPNTDYCSTCEICGRPGHLRHHPGAVPITGSWCNFHYKVLSLTHSSTFPGAIIITSSIILISWMIMKLNTMS